MRRRDGSPDSPAGVLPGAPGDPIRSVLDGLLEGLQVISSSYEYLYVNAAAAAHGRTTPQALLGRTMQQVYPGVERTPMFSALRRCMEQRQPEKLDNEFVFGDGGSAWFELRMRPVPEGVAVLSLDITARKRAEQALRESEQRYRGLVANVEDVVYSTDAEGRLLYVSPAIERLYGYRAEDLVGRHFVEVVLPEDVPGLLASFGRTLAGKYEPYEFRAYDHAGRVRHVRSTSRPRLVGGEPAGLDGVLIDFTELHRAVRSEQESLRAHRALLGNLPGIAYRCSNVPKWTMEVIGGACEELTGYPAAALVGDSLVSFGELIHPDDRQRVWDEVQAAVAEGRRFSRSYRIATANGALKWVSERGVSVPAAAGVGPGVLEGFIMDITGEVAARAEQERLSERLQRVQRLEAVGRLAGGVAHDFNNLLSVIISYANFAADELRDRSGLRADVLEIRDAGERAAKLTRQLLAFSRRQVLEPVPLDLNASVRDIARMLARLLGEHIHIDLKLGEGLATVRADPGQVEQVLVNLAVNARDAMPKGGRLTIRTANATLPPGEDEGAAGGEPARYALLEVADTGCGMDEATRALIFEPFFTTKPTGEGTGLGLSTAYGIVKQSGGHITLRSEPGRGTTFGIYLPVDDSEAPEPRHRTMSPPPGRQETVLVVEDEDAVRRLAVRILQRKGYVVLTAASGEQALQVVQHHPTPIDLLLTDVVMPTMSGAELAERLGELQPGLRTLYMSGYPDAAIAPHGVLEPGVHFLGKPFSVAGLRAKVREVLDAPAATS